VGGDRVVLLPGRRLRSLVGAADLKHDAADGTDLAAAVIADWQGVAT
jgi:hypothetical protein